MKFGKFSHSDLDHEHDWWNRPLWGDKTMLEKLFSHPDANTKTNGNNELEIPEKIISIHNQELQRLKELNIFLVKLEDEKFTSQEFIFLIKIKSFELKGIDEYQKISYSSKLLTVGLNTKAFFEILEDIELHYRGKKQQELYNFVSNLLAKNLTKTQYLNKIHKNIADTLYLTKSSKNRKELLSSYKKSLINLADSEIGLKLLKFLLSQNLNNKQFVKSIYLKLNEILPQIKSEEGTLSLKRYAKALESLAHQELALKLLSLFKKYNLADYSLLSYIAELKTDFATQNLTNFAYFFQIVNNNTEKFSKLAQIIEVPDSLNTPATSARILQYFALIDRYQGTFATFKRLISILQEWQKRYSIVLKIRKECLNKGYTLPSEFKEELPGFKIYQKYKSHLAYLSLKS